MEEVLGQRRDIASSDMLPDPAQAESSTRVADTPMSENNDNDNDNDSGNGSTQCSESSYDPTTALMLEIAAPRGAASRKRKPPELGPVIGQGNAKKAKAASGSQGCPQNSLSMRPDRSTQLPAEIWHNVFTFLPPRSLGNLLSVSKLFHNYLDPSPRVKISYPHFPDPVPLLPHRYLPLRKSLSLLRPDAIWQASRRLFWPRMPAPLTGRSEVDMWRITCSRVCQFCNVRGDSSGEVVKDAWHRGPGSKGVSPTFPFSIVSCGSCLTAKSLKEIDVLLSSTIPSALLPGLAAAFLTPELHIIPPQTMQNGTPITQGQVNKIYWGEQLETVKNEFAAVMQLGAAAAEEWLKGLEARGKKALADASRWEKWELSGGVDQMRLSAARSPTAPSFSTQSTSQSIPPNRHNHSQLTPQAPKDNSGENVSGMAAKSSNLIPKTNVNPSGPQSQSHQKRTKEEVAQLKKKRRAEIERRAGLLEPPLLPAVLAHIASFRAALQIPAPLDENAWEVLKPRLLAQRADAEKRERESRLSAKSGTDVVPVHVKAEAPVANPKKVTDEEWDEIQGPVRARISSYADEIIRDGWKQGEKVSKKNCAQFAAEVLLYVRKRFYAEVAKDAAAALAAGGTPVVEPPEGPWTQKLTLENMKWVFDVKIKPHTEKRNRKELFLCNGCATSLKYYGLEGVIQHYAAKHTNALSHGSVVVYWRAEWPETPLFSPDPKHPALKQPAERETQPTPSTVVQPPLGQPSYNTAPPAYQAPQYGPPESHGHVPVPYAPAVTHGRGHGPPTHPLPPQPYTVNIPYAPYSLGPWYGGAYPPASKTSGSHGALNAPLYNGYTPSSYQGHSAPPTSAADPNHVYQDRLGFMAKVGKQTWNTISSINGLVGAVKLYVTIHHIAKGFQFKFSESAPLAMFIDGLSNRKEMRPLRSLNGLKCKACMEGLPGDVQHKAFTAPQLVKHFNKEHVETKTRPLDWRTQMVMLSDIPVLEDLPKSLAQHKTAYDIVADALPWPFNGDVNTQPSRHIGTQSFEEYNGNSVQPSQPVDHYSPAHNPAPLHGGAVPTYQPDPNAARERLADQTSQHLSHLNSDMPELKPASQVYDRADAVRLPKNRQPENGGCHPQYHNKRPNYAPWAVVEERPREVLGLQERFATHPSLAAEASRERRDKTLSAYPRNGGYPQNGFDAREGWQDGRTHLDPRAVASRAEGNGILDALESHLDGDLENSYRMPPTYVGTQPPYQPPDPARYPQAAGWLRPQRPASPPLHPNYDYHRESNAPQGYCPASHHEPGYLRRGTPSPRPVEEYEILEIRDPEQGTYYIRRPIRYEVYSYDVRRRGRPEDQSFYDGNRHAGAVAPTSRADYEEYDPRFPAGVAPARQSGYP